MKAHYANSTSLSSKKQSDSTMNAAAAMAMGNHLVLDASS